MDPKARRGLGLPVVLAFWLLAVFVAFNGFLAYQHTERVYQNGRAVAEGYERVAASARLLSLMRDAETGQRGFLLTGEDRYLEPYHEAQDELATTLLKLKSLGSLGAEEDRLFAAVRSAIAAKMAELAEAIALRRHEGPEAAKAEVLTDRGRQAMVDIRLAAAAIDGLEAKELIRRAEQTRVSYRSAIVARALATLLGLGLVLGAYRLSDRSATERASHAAMSHEQAERFRVTLASIGDAVMVTDAQAKLRFMNPVAERLTGWESGWEGLPVSDVFRIQDEASRKPDEDPVQQVLRERQVVALENRTELVRRNGEVVPIDDSAAPIFDSEGLLTGVVLVFRDMTQRRKAEILVHRQKEALEEGDRRKNEFLAMLAHELRNPLAALRNAIEVLRLVRGDSEEGDQARGIIERQIRQMARMVDDLIDIARISTGRMTLRRGPVEIRDIVHAATETTSSLFQEKRHRVTVRLPDEPLFVDGDAVRLAQVLTNLLSNAARYTEAGGSVELAVSREGSSTVLRVSDNGMGMSADLLPQVFDLFWQGHRSVGAAQGGLGIGLTLARRVVEMHQGSIEAASSGPGRGSTFVVTLPLSTAPGPRVPEAESASEPHRVLIVEDNDDARQALESMLRLRGHQVASAADGAQALAEAKRFRPSVALIDLGLPDLSGYEVARRLRLDPALAGVKLVAVTGWAQDEDRQQSLAAGFDRHLVKPVEPEAVFRLLASFPAVAGEEDV
jgi:PAS domain S-box-containing protein